MFLYKSKYTFEMRISNEKINDNEFNLIREIKEVRISGLIEHDEFLISEDNDKNDILVIS